MDAILASDGVLFKNVPYAKRQLLGEYHWTAAGKRVEWAA